MITNSSNAILIGKKNQPFLKDRIFIFSTDRGRLPVGSILSNQSVKPLCANQKWKGKIVIKLAIVCAEIIPKNITLSGVAAIG